MKQETIFNVGDKVFDYNYGWGIVVGGSYTYGYDLLVNFEKETHSYTRDGRLSEKANPSLSFTEYTLEGFSQERKDKLPNKGDVVWVRDHEKDNWRIAIFLSIDEYNQYRCTFYNPTEVSSSLVWRYLTTENPYKQ